MISGKAYDWLRGRLFSTTYKKVVFYTNYGNITRHNLLTNQWHGRNAPWWLEFFSRILLFVLHRQRLIFKCTNYDQCHISPPHFIKKLNNIQVAKLFPLALQFCHCQGLPLTSLDGWVKFTLAVSLLLLLSTFVYNARLWHQSFIIKSGVTF